MGDYTVGDTIYRRFSTRSAAGVPTTLAGTPAVSIYEDSSVTQITAGITLGVDHDSVTGLNLLTIVASGANGFEAGKFYDIVITTGTVDSVSVVGEVIGSFTLSKEAAAIDLANATDGLGALKADTAAVLLDTGTDGVVVAAASKTGYRLSATGVDDIFDESLSGHVAAGSAGAALYVIRSGTAQAGAGTSITLDASASATDDFYNNQFVYIVGGTGVGQGRIISDYNGTTKVATVSTWATNPDATSVFVIRPFGSVPGASAPTASEVADAVWDEAKADHVAEGSFGSMVQSFHDGTAQAASSTSITLDATGSSSTTDFYKYAVIEIISGTGAKQSRQITAYNGTSKAATVDPAWTTTPSTDSVYTIKGLGLDAATTSQIADAVWDEARSGHVSAGTFGEYVLADSTRISGSTSAADGIESAVSGATPLPANMTQISGDGPAADNAEAFFDGTGYAGTGNTIPTVTNVGTVTGNVNGSVASVSGAVGSVTGAVGSVTGNVGGNVVGSTASVTATVSADVVSISGDTTSADNLELYTDGTTPMPVNATQISGSATAADNLEASALGIVAGACEATPSTTSIQTDLAETTDDHYNGRIVVFTSGPAAGQATDITDYTGATGTLTVTALTDAPVAGNTFVII